MQKSNSVTSPQDGPHEDLEKSIAKYLASTYKRPIQDHTKKAFERVLNQVEALGNSSIILDSACGVGMSTFKLAVQNPNATVIGIDKSQDRILKSDWYSVNVERSSGVKPTNAIIERADVIDFWRLVLEANVEIKKHYILYPNPWPKTTGFNKRWQGHPIFPILCDVCDSIELRSNWKLYLEEFNAAYSLVKSKTGLISEIATNGEYLTAFEKKFAESDQKLWKLTIGE